MASHVSFSCWDTSFCWRSRSRSETQCKANGWKLSAVSRSPPSLLCLSTFGLEVNLEQLLMQSLILRRIKSNASCTCRGQVRRARRYTSCRLFFKMHCKEVHHCLKSTGSYTILCVGVLHTWWPLGVLCFVLRCLCWGINCCIICISVKGERCEGLWNGLPRWDGAHIRCSHFWENASACHHSQQLLLHSLGIPLHQEQ